MSPPPVYRYPPRSHASSCRCKRCAPFRNGAGTSAGAAGPWILIGFIVILIGFWPAMVWHGEGGPVGTSWRWDIHSTIAELVYFGVIVFVAAAWRLGNRVAVPSVAAKVTTATPPAPPPSVCVPAVPSCAHPDAVPVNLSTGERVAWLCPDCGEGFDPGWRSAELSPDPSWPPVRRVSR